MIAVIIATFIKMIKIIFIVSPFLNLKMLIPSQELIIKFSSLNILYSKNNINQFVCNMQ